jgi:hypothetical protein
MERGEQALTGNVVAANQIVIARLDRATQYAVTAVLFYSRKAVGYWITRFRG